jgi:nucleoside-diphosphate-sugar epimerase
MSSPSRAIPTPSLSGIGVSRSLPAMSTTPPPSPRVPFAKTPVTVYSGGVINIVAGMRAGGVKRFVCVSSSAIGPHPEPLGGLFFERIIQPYIVKKVGRTLYEDMRRMEAMVTDSDLAWTIVRPSGLFEAPTVSAYAVATDYFGHRFTARIDLADCLLRHALDDTHVRSTIAVATPSANPSMLKLVWQEGIRKKTSRSMAPGR